MSVESPSLHSQTKFVNARTSPIRLLATKIRIWLIFFFFESRICLYVYVIY